VVSSFKKWACRSRRDLAAVQISYDTGVVVGSEHRSGGGR